MSRVTVTVDAEDAVSRAGVLAMLRRRPEFELVDAHEAAEVTVMVLDQLDDEGEQRMRALRSEWQTRIVLLVRQIETQRLTTAIDCGVVGLMLRAEVSPDSLPQAVLAAASGRGSMSGDLLSRLFEQVSRLQRQADTGQAVGLSYLTGREQDVLRLVADGLDTTEIAAKLSYSERTVKKCLYELNSRLQLRNRAHAVGYAMRHGLI
ncbi:response regulator transcription factor [Amycolatopsis sp. CA-230715]|uniref:response regulator transcription factor n=1 Tax=Amycolatopsis sp. CA-230715 TaxID=2745196 RepID=UPI001C0398D6|nr:response regulator transcription factor [Amycolatopsis sp. CA-230715]QWF77841.1 Transcriptional regulatory protein DegU [Amycolatopsis sp. CA-230715]